MGSSSVTRDWTPATCVGSSATQPLDHQGSPQNKLKKKNKNTKQIILFPPTRPQSVSLNLPMLFQHFNFQQFVYNTEYKLQPPECPGPLPPQHLPKTELSPWGSSLPLALCWAAIPRSSCLSGGALPGPVCHTSLSNPTIQSHSSPEFLPGTYHALNILFVHFYVCLFMFHLL